MRLWKFLPLMAVLGGASLVSGCAGYKVGPIKPTMLAGFKTIAVQAYKNDTLEPRVEVLMANALIKQLQQDGTYTIADEKDADLVLQGTLLEIVRRSSRSVRGNVLQTREYTLNLRTIYTLTDRRTGKTIDRRAINGATSFFVSGSNPTAADVNQDERQALPLAAEDVAARMTSQLTEGW